MVKAKVKANPLKNHLTPVSPEATGRTTNLEGEDGDPYQQDKG